MERISFALQGLADPNPKHQQKPLFLTSLNDIKTLTLIVDCKDEVDDEVSDGNGGGLYTGMNVLYKRMAQEGMNITILVPYRLIFAAAAIYDSTRPYL